MVSTREGSAPRSVVSILDVYVDGGHCILPKLLHEEADAVMDQDDAIPVGDDAINCQLLRGRMGAIDIRMALHDSTLWYTSDGLLHDKRPAVLDCTGRR